MRWETWVWGTLAVLSGIGCTKVQPDSTLSEEQIGPMAQESRDVILQISERGVVRLELEAGRMMRYEDPDSVYSLFESNDGGGSRVTATFFDSTGSMTGTLSAERIRFNETDHTMIANGDVVLESGAGRRLQSEELRWDEDRGMIEAPGFLSLTTEDQNIRGYELEATEDLSSWSIQRPTGRVTIREE